VSNFPQVGFRLLYSPLSRILSIHYISFNPYSIPETKKLNSELASYIEVQTTQAVETSHFPQSSVPFLTRNKRTLEERGRDLTNIEIRNDIVFRVRYQLSS